MANRAPWTCPLCKRSHNEGEKLEWQGCENCKRHHPAYNDELQWVPDGDYREPGLALTTTALAGRSGGEPEARGREAGIGRPTAG